MTSEPGGGDALLELRDNLIVWLWRLYGYAMPLEKAPPVTIDRVRSEADEVLDLIEAAGYVIVERGRWEFVLDMAREEVEPWEGER